MRVAQRSGEVVESGQEALTCPDAGAADITHP